MSERAPIVFWCAFTVCAVALSCSGERVGGARRVPASGADAATPQAKESASKSQVKNGRAVVTAADARAKGLPPIGFSVEWPRPRLFLGSVLAHEGTYLTLSGPPGGPLGMSVRGYTNADANHGILETVIVEHPPRPPVIRGAPETIDLAGAARPALAYIQGESLARSLTCLALVPSPGNKREGLVVRFYVAAGSAMSKAACKTVVERPSIAPLVASFRLH